MCYNQVSTVAILLTVDTIHIDSINMCNRTPLRVACRYGSVSSIQLYTQDTRCTQDVLNRKDSVGYTALMGAVYRGHLDTVKHLATVPGVDFNTKDNEGRTLVEVAREEKHVDMVVFYWEETKQLVWQ